MHCNVFAANNVMHQQNGPFHRCRGLGVGVMGVHSMGKVWSTIALFIMRWFV